MADLIYTPRRPGIRLIVHTADIVNVVKQHDVLASMSEDELSEIVEAMMLELNVRTNPKVEK